MWSFGHKIYLIISEVFINILNRSLIDVTRTVVIWAVAIILTLTTETKKWENTRW